MFLISPGWAQYDRIDEVDSGAVQWRVGSFYSLQRPDVRAGERPECVNQSNERARD